MRDDSAIHPRADFLPQLQRRSGQPVSRCYQCRKCTHGCPLSFAMDLLPHQVMRMAELGLKEELLRSKTIWICAACQTCTTRCPNDIDIAHLMDVLRQWSQAAGIPAAEGKVVPFHKLLLDSVRRHGRVFELGMVARYKLATGDLLADAKMGWQMWKKGKLRLLPANVQGKREIREMFARQAEE